MPARPRLASTAFDLALEVRMKYPDDEGVKELVVMMGSLHYTNELILAFANRGIDGNQARRLFREYERFQKRINEQQTGAVAQ